MPGTGNIARRRWGSRRANGRPLSQREQAQQRERESFEQAMRDLGLDDLPALPAPTHQGATDGPVGSPALPQAHQCH